MKRYLKTTCNWQSVESWVWLGTRIGTRNSKKYATRKGRFCTAAVFCGRWRPPTAWILYDTHLCYLLLIRHLRGLAWSTLELPGWGGKYKFGSFSWDIVKKSFVFYSHWGLLNDATNWIRMQMLTSHNMKEKRKERWKAGRKRKFAH